MSGGPDEKRAILKSILPADVVVVTSDAAIALAGATIKSDSTSRVGGVLLLGGLGTLFGATIGHGIDTFHFFHPSHRNRWPDDEESRSRPSTGSPAEASAARSSP